MSDMKKLMESLDAISEQPSGRTVHVVMNVSSKTIAGIFDSKQKAVSHIIELYNTDMAGEPGFTPVKSYRQIPAAFARDFGYAEEEVK